MKEKIRKITIGILLTLIFVIMYTTSAVAVSTVEYTIDPEEPTPQSDVKITAEIIDEDITSVYLEMQECNTAGTCFGWKTNVSMKPTGVNNEYKATINLIREDTNIFHFDLPSKKMENGNIHQLQIIMMYTLIEAA